MVAEHVDPQIRSPTKTLHPAKILVWFFTPGNQSDNCGDDRDRAQEQIANRFSCDLQLKYRDVQNQTHSRVMMSWRGWLFFVGHSDEV